MNRGSRFCQDYVTILMESRDTFDGSPSLVFPSVSQIEDVVEHLFGENRSVIDRLYRASTPAGAGRKASAEVAKVSSPRGGGVGFCGRP